MKRVLLAACLVAAMATPSPAENPPSQTGAAPAPAQAGPPEAGSDAPAAPGDAVRERQRNSAAKLGGMVTFVSESCPDAKPDFTRFKQVIAAMGVDIKDLEQGGPLMVRLASYVQAYQRDVAQSCKRALALFGPSGTAIPGLIGPRGPDDREP